MRTIPALDGARAAIPAAVCACLVVPKLLLVDDAAIHVSLVHGGGDLPFPIAPDLDSSQRSAVLDRLAAFDAHPLRAHRR